MGYMANGYLFIVGRAKDMIIINGKNHWPQDIEWAVEQLPGFHQGDIAAFTVETENGEEVPAVLVHCRVSDPDERVRLHDQIREKVRSITGMNCVVELVPPRTLPRTSSRQAQPGQGEEALPVGRNRAVQARGLGWPKAAERHPSAPPARRLAPCASPRSRPPS